VRGTTIVLVLSMGTNSGDNSGSPSQAQSREFDCHCPVDQHDEQGLEVSVVFTDPPGTLAALRLAEKHAQKLNAHIELLMPYEVPYTLPLTKPAVPVGFLEGQARNLASSIGLDVVVHIYLCRDKKRTLDLIMRGHSLAVVGGKKRWWPTSAQKLALDLQKAGHHVIFAELR
jgi:hypothetical protein